MGVDLTIIPMQYDPPTLGGVYPHTQIQCERRRELFGEIEEAAMANTLECTLYWLDEEEGLEKISEDRYGTPLRWMRASVLAEFLNADPSPNTLNRAATAYLKALDPTTRVILFWH